LKGKDIYRLVSQLSKVEKTGFKAHLGSRSPELRKLFDKLNKAPVYTDKILEGFGLPKEMYRLADKLRDEIIASLASNEPYSIVKTYLDYDLGDVAVKCLYSETNQYLSKGNYPLVLEAHKIVDFWEDLVPSIKSILDHLPPVSKLLEIVSTTERLRLLVKRVRALKSFPPREIQIGIRGLKEELYEIDPYTAEQQFLYWKANSRIEILGGDITKARDCQECVVNSMEAWEVEDFEWVKEMVLLANFHIACGDYNQAEKINLRLGLRDLKPVAELKKLAHIHFSSLLIGMGSGNFSRGLESIDGFLERTPEFSPRLQASVFHIASLLALYSGETDLQLRLAHRLHELPRKIRKDFEWANALVLWIGYEQIGDIDMQESLEKRFYRRTAAEEVDSPRIFFRALKGSLTPDEARNQILGLRSDPSEELCHSYFHFLEYLDGMDGGNLEEIFSRAQYKDIKGRLGSK